MGFIIAAAILVAAVLAILAFPWWRRGGGKAPPPLSGEELVEELDDDVATGLLAAEDLRPAARDLEMTVVGDGGKAPPPRFGWRWAMALVVVPVGAVALYAHFGDWRAALLGPQAAVRHQVEASLAQLRTHLAAHPGDLQGWLNLGQGDEALGRYRKAAEAFGRAARLETSPDPDVLAVWAEAQILADPQHLTAQERRLFAKVLALDPGNARALWYGGLIALSDGDRARARQYWQRLLAQPGVPAQVASVVRSHLAMMGGAAASTAAAPTAAARTLNVVVRVAPALATNVRNGETLYVFVRNPGGGPPLAVRRIAVQRLPVTIDLSDADAMMSGHDLSSASGPLEVVARLAPAGTAEPQAGDLVGTHRIASVQEGGPVTVTIDHRLQSGG